MSRKTAVRNENKENGNMEDDEGKESGRGEVEEECLVGVRVGRRPPMSEIDQLRLRAIFINKKAEKWTKKERKQNIDHLLNDVIFKHLTKAQIMRRHNLFTTEVVLREKYGTKFFNATVAMRDIDGVSREIHTHEHPQYIERVGTVLYAHQ